MSQRGHQGGDYGARLTRVEAAIGELRRGQEATSAKLDAISSAISDMRATSGPPVAAMVDMGVKVAGLFAAIVAGILYLAGGSHSAELRELDKRISRIETVLSMATVRRAPAPSTWAPGTAHWR